MQQISDVIAGGCDYLISKQHLDGYWCDFELPTGKSDAWVTAFVALSLTHANVNVQSKKITEAIRCAIQWLVSHRDYASGWGYNRITGADADTTAYVLTLLRENDYPMNRNDVAFLVSLQCPCGGFSTYAEKSAWGQPHPDVTPVAFVALQGSKTDSLTEEVMVHYLDENQWAPGFWPSYWWKNCFYSSYHNLKLSIDLGAIDRPKSLGLPTGDGFAVESAFDLAWLTATASLYSDKAYGVVLSEELILLQQPEGYWEGAGNLRVTDPACISPWINPVGKYYVDFQHSITTASAVWALSLH